MRKISILWVMIYLLTVTQSFAQKIHAILVIDREDKAIGCEVDEINIKKMLKQAGIEASMPVAYYTPNNSITDVKKEIANLVVGKDDAIFFYYSGHGYRYQNQTTKYPYMHLKDVSFRGGNDNTKEKLVERNVVTETKVANALSLEQVSTLLRAKNARITMTIGDLCNSTIPALEPTPIAANVITLNNYERLFKKSKGYFIVCSSKPGQPSLGGERDGGVFTNAFLVSYKKIVDANQKADWKDVFNNSYSLTKQMTSSRAEPQTPVVDEINVTYYE